MLGWQAAAQKCEGIVSEEPELVGSAFSSLLLVVQAALDCGSRGSCDGGFAWAVLCGAMGILAAVGAGACSRVERLQASLKWCALVLLVWWSIGLGRLTSDAPYVRLDAAYVACWSGFTLSGALCLREWRAILWPVVELAQPPTKVLKVVPSDGVGDTVAKCLDKTGWSLQRVSDPRTINAIHEMIHVTDPENLGRGRDVRARERYTDLVVAFAWKIHNPDKEMMYDLKKEFVRTDLRVLQESKVATPAVETKLDSSGEMIAALDKAVNEKILLHGTKPEHVMSIIHNGLNEKLSGGTFGKGVYLAEDSSKIDQYCTPDARYGEGPEDVILLQKMLYDAGSHSGNLFYCFIVKAVLGVPMSTKDGETNMAAPFQPIFATTDQRELALIPDLSLPMHHHSLVAEAGRGHKVERHREFVVFEGDRLKLEYLVAFQRW